jgi:hypothetical protein
MENVVDEFDDVKWTEAAAKTAVPFMPSKSSPPPEQKPTFFQVLQGKDPLKPDVAAAFGITPVMETRIRKMLRKIVTSGTSPVRQYHVLFSPEAEIVPHASQHQDPIILAFKDDVQSDDVWEALHFARVEMENPVRSLILGVLDNFAQGEMCDWCGTSSGSLKKCSLCKVMFYCSKECQKAHWKKIHKKTCAGV